MKLAKSRKIIILLTAIALCAILAVCSLSLFTGKAATVSSSGVSTCFSGVTPEITEDGAKFVVENEKTVSTKKLAIDNMAITFGAINNVSKIELTLKYDSFYVNGNKNPDGKFDKEIKNTFELTPNANDTVAIKVENNAVKVDGVDNGEYYKIRKIDKASANLEFKVYLTDTEAEAYFIIESIDQNVGVSGYNQSLKKDTDGNLSVVKPVIDLDADMFVRDANGVYSLKAYAGDLYSLSYTVYSVINKVKASDLYPTLAYDTVDEATMKIPTGDKKENNQDKIHFWTGDDRVKNFNISYKDGDTEVDCATYTVNILKKLDKTALDTQNKAPEYNLSDSLALEAFMAELEKQYLVENPAQGESKYVPLGTDVEIPSLEDLVIDDRTPYDKLTKKLYYVSGSESSSSTLEIPLNAVGDYYFYVVFTDSEEKGMDSEEQFVKFDENNNVTYGVYGSSKAQIEENANNQKFIFYFSILEDAKIVIEEPSSQGRGYIGTKYTASKFTIKASNYNTTYKLEYAEEKDATEWIEIKQLKDVTEDYDEDGYDYERLESINYNGQYTFTPDEKGYYRITCDISSDMTFRTATASTIIEVTEEVKVITPPSTWFADNVWSVVFLSVGTLCLIGILVLLFVKPKDKTADEEE